MQSVEKQLRPPGFPTRIEMDRLGIPYRRTKLFLYRWPDFPLTAWVSGVFDNVLLEINPELLSPGPRPRAWDTRLLIHLDI